MPMPFNMLTVGEPAERALPLPLPTYETLANLAGVKPGSIGGGWMLANLETSWEEALKNRTKRRLVSATMATRAGKSMAMAMGRGKKFFIKIESLLLIGLISC